MYFTTGIPFPTPSYYFPRTWVLSTLTTESTITPTSTQYTVLVVGTRRAVQGQVFWFSFLGGGWGRRGGNGETISSVSPVLWRPCPKTLVFTAFVPLCTSECKRMFDVFAKKMPLVTMPTTPVFTAVSGTTVTSMKTLVFAAFASLHNILRRLLVLLPPTTSAPPTTEYHKRTKPKQISPGPRAVHQRSCQAASAFTSPGPEH